MIFYKLGSMLLFIFVFLLLFGSFWHVYIWTDYFSNHIGYAILLAILSAIVFWFIVKKINTVLRENTLNNILKDMNSHINPEAVLHKYKSCIVDWKRIESPIRTIYRFILNHPLKIWNYHLAEEMIYDQDSKSWKLLREPGTWELYAGPEVPDDVPIGECRRCKHQIYEDDLEELDDKEMGSTCIECGSNDLDLRHK
jgi:hypothetical protein